MREDQEAKVLRNSISIGALFVLAAALGSTTVGAQPAGTNGQRCLSSHEFQNWKAPNARTMFMRFGLNRYFRLGLAAKCPALLWPDAHLVTVFHGSDLICSPNDWDLKVAAPGTGVAEPCIVNSMRELTPAEVDAIPKRFKP